MKVAILGFGSQGKSAMDYWRDKGDDITVCDQKIDLAVPEGVSSKLGAEHLNELYNFDLIVRSPIVHPSSIIQANDAQILGKVTTVTNEFIRICPSKNIIGVTGTKGKGTTSTLITKILETAGKKVHLGGNIGIPPLELLKNNIQPDDWVVLELANFQLIDLKHSPNIAVCLMVEPEHMDWHKDLAEYFTAKQQLFLRQTNGDTAIYYGLNPNSEHIASVSPGAKVPYMKHPGADVIEDNFVIDGQTVCSVSEVKLLGRHNWQNICAAITSVWQITQDLKAISEALMNFSGLEHRLEFVREFKNVKYYDDSFGTTPETAIVAIEAFEEPKIVILGGSDKGSDYTKLAQTVSKSDVRRVILIGEMAEKIRLSLESAGYTDTVYGGDSMDEIVSKTSVEAREGDVVLLSTGCASFGLFENYKDRGEQFKRAVLALS